VAGEDEILDWVRRDAETALHPSCTARMGVDEHSVVDPSTMRVHGTEGLRVVDASVFPYVTNGNIYAPVMMVAEKAADLITGSTPLPPAEVAFYRHRELMPLYPPGDPRNAVAATDPAATAGAADTQEVAR
jgi:choline dehydrogenase